MIYVLTLRMRGPLGNEWRPVAVLDETRKEVADQWANASDDQDWIGFEMNDLSLTGLSEKKFEPKPPTPAEEKARMTEAAIGELKKTNAELIGIVEQLAKKYKDTQVLSAIKLLKAQGKVSSKEVRDLSAGTRVWSKLYPDTMGSVVKFAPNKKDPSKSIITVKWDDDKYGTFDVHLDAISFGQAPLFAKLLRKKE